MGFKLKSSGLPFKELGSSPAKQETAETDATSVAKPISPKVIQQGNKHDNLSPSNAEYVDDFFKKPGKGKAKAKMHEPGHKEKGRYGKAERKELKKVKTKGMSVSDFDDTKAKAAVMGAVTGGATTPQKPEKKSTNRKIKEFLYGGEKKLQRKEELVGARKDKRDRREEARHQNKLDRINKPTRAEKKRGKINKYNAN